MLHVFDRMHGYRSILAASDFVQSLRKWLKRMARHRNRYFIVFRTLEQLLKRSERHCCSMRYVYAHSYSFEQKLPENFSLYGLFYRDAIFDIQMLTFSRYLCLRRYGCGVTHGEARKQRARIVKSLRRLASTMSERMTNIHALELSAEDEKTILS